MSNTASKRTVLWVMPGLFYLLFCFWYTDLSGPLSKDEVANYVALLEQEGVAPERIASVRRFMEADTGKQFIMVNLLDMADSPPSVPGAPAGATANDLLDLYMAYMYPALLQRACHPVFVGDVVHEPLDKAGIDHPEHWERSALMRYRSRRDMIEIATNPAFREQHKFKIAALENTIAFPVETVLYGSDLRFLLFLVLFSLVAATDIAIYGRLR